MQAFVWSPAYETGIATVDAQHRRLVELINAFGDAVTTSSAGPKVAETFAALAAYAQEHFGDEEAMMRRRGIDPRFFEGHQRVHRTFLEEVALMNQHTSDDAPRVLMTFLVSWLAFHILGTDQQMARQLKLIAEQVSPADAFDREGSRDDASARLVLGAVDDLLHVVGARNQQLSDANATLERRVTERTRDLAAALADLKAAQQTAIETAKLASVGQLASGLAHEINNPLSFLGPNVDYLAEASERLLELASEYQAAEPRVSDAALRQSLEASRERAQLPSLRTELPQVVKETAQGLARVKAIVRDMRGFSSVDTAGLTATELNRCLDTVLAVLPADLKSRATLAKDFGATGTVRCVAAQLNQTLLALVTNALQAVADAAPRPGTVTLRTGEAGGEAWVEVVDTGVGLSQEAQAHLFEPFFTTRPPGQGFGLGLSGAWKFAQHHGGKLEVKGQPGEGTRVKLTLLKAGPTSMAAPAPVANSYNDRRK